MTSALRSKIVAVALGFALATPFVIASAVVAPTPAEAGLISSVKSAAKKVGGAAKSTAKGFGEVGKVIGGQVKGTAKDVGRMVKSGAGTAGRTVVNGGSKVVHKIGRAGGAAVGGVSKAGRAIGKRL